MSISISGAYSDPSTLVDPVVQATTPAATTPVIPASDTLDEDTVTLSQSAQVDQLNLQGASPTQIAEKLGISLANVDLDLGIVTAAESVPTTAAPAAPAPAKPASTTPVTSTPATAATTPTASPGVAVKSASV
jgi:hypothetical protein